VKNAVIEVGSNGVRYELIEASSNAKETLDRRTKRENLTERLSKFPGRPDIAMKDTVDVILTYQKLAKQEKANHIKIVGTEVCRKIQAIDPLFWGKYGIDLRVLTPSDEARYGFKSAETTLGANFAVNPRATIDVGNGSTDIFLVDQDGVEKFHSWPIGAASLEEAFRKENGSIDAVVKKIPSEIMPRGTKKLDLSNSNVVLMGGLITKISWVSFRHGPQERYRSDRLNGYASSTSDVNMVFNEVFEHLKTGGIAGAREFVDPYEAETWKLLQVLSGCKYFDFLSSNFGFTNFTVCGASLRHGVLAELSEGLR